jgi:hypothetical protein
MAGEMLLEQTVLEVKPAVEDKQKGVSARCVCRMAQTGIGLPLPASK